VRHRDGRIVAGFAGEHGYVRSFRPNRVKRIQIFAAEGDDSVTIGPELRGAYVDAGAGDDVIFTSPTTDTLVGGSGDDEVNDDPLDLVDGIETRTA
jgi:Ca2+-binding RTX toxin-like protein